MNIPIIIKNNEQSPVERELEFAASKTAKSIWQSTKHRRNLFHNDKALWTANFGSVKDKSSVERELQFAAGILQPYKYGSPQSLGEIYFATAKAMWKANFSSQHKT